MSVTYELIDAPYPYLCAIFRCPCGAACVQHAEDASTPPAGWKAATPGGEDYHCPDCCAAAGPPLPAR
jgi:hypothetical protein